MKILVILIVSLMLFCGMASAQQGAGVFTEPSLAACQANIISPINGGTWCLVSGPPALIYSYSGGIYNQASGGSSAATSLQFGATNQTLSSVAPTGGQFLSYNGSNIVGASPTGSGTVNSGTGPALGQYPGGTGTTIGPITLSGDATIAQGGAITVTKSGGVPFATSATTDTTNASNITNGTLPANQLPNPSSSTLGGVRSFAPVTNQWINTISTSGVPSSTQPAFSNISGAATAAQIPNPAGDLGGTYALSTVTGLHFGATGLALGTAPSSGQCLAYNGSTITGAACSGGGSIPGNTLATHNFANSIDNTGVISGAQPDFTDLTGTATAAQIPDPVGDVTGTYAATAVTGMTFGGVSLPTGTIPSSGQCLSYNGTFITGAACSAGGGTGVVSSGTGPAIAQYNAGTGTTVSPSTLSLDATIAQGGAVSVKGLHFGATDIQTGTIPTSGQCLSYNGSTITGAACSAGVGITCKGTATLVAGNVVVSDGCITTTNSIILQSADDLNHVSFYKLAAGSFTIVSSNPLDTSTVIWSQN